MKLLCNGARPRLPAVGSRTSAVPSYGQDRDGAKRDGEYNYLTAVRDGVLFLALERKEGNCDKE